MKTNIKNSVAFFFAAALALCGLTPTWAAKTSLVQKQDFTLLETYVDGAPNQGTVTMPDDVKLKDGEVWYWFDCPRYSESEDARNLWRTLNGLIGAAVGTGNLTQITNGLDVARFGSFTTPSCGFGFKDLVAMFLVARVRTSDGAILSIGGVRERRYVTFAESSVNEMFGTGQVSVNYYAWDEKSNDVILQVPVMAIQLTDETTELQDGQWYVAIGKWVCKPITVSGQAHLVCMQYSSVDFCQQVKFADGASLSIYGTDKMTYHENDWRFGHVEFSQIQEEEQNPVVSATGTINVHGASVFVGRNLHCGSLNVYGGFLESRGVGEAAAITVDKEMVVKGGWVWAWGDDGCTGAGIGGKAGADGCSVRIDGGWVEAVGGEGAAGIGAGAGGKAHGNLTIAGGLHTWVSEDDDGSTPKFEAEDYAASRERCVWVSAVSELVQPQEFTVVKNSDGSFDLSFPEPAGDGYCWGLMKFSVAFSRMELAKDEFLGDLIFAQFSQSVEVGSWLVGEDSMSDAVGELEDMSSELFGSDVKPGDVKITFTGMDDLDILLVCKVTDDPAHDIITMGGVRNLYDMMPGASAVNEITTGDEPEPEKDPLGSPKNPWDVGMAGNGLPAAYTNGQWQVCVYGAGQPKEFAGDDAPWAGMELKEIFVPQGRVDEFRKAWPYYSKLITDGTQKGIEYFAWNGEEVAGPNAANARPLTADMSVLDSGWYVVQGVVSNFTGITVKGDVHLILADGAELYVNGEASGLAGIGVNVDPGDVTNSISIYRQKGNAGKLIAIGADSGAGIGSQEPEGTEHDGNRGVLPIDCGVITIHGGNILASSCTGSGIGGFAYEGYTGVYGGTITIYGGSVKATGGGYGAGIGSAGGFEGYGDEPSCRIDIYGGYVTAYQIDLEDSKGGGVGAGIGGGICRNGGIVNIYGGTVWASAQMSAGIGGGILGAGGTVTVYAGDVTAVSEPIVADVVDNKEVLMYASGIGGGFDGEGIGDPGTFALGPKTKATILVGTDPTGKETTPVAAGDFRGTEKEPGWYVNCYVQITATEEDPVPPEVLEAREKAKEQIEKAAGPSMTRSDEMDEIVRTALDEIGAANTVEQVAKALGTHLPKVADQYAKDNAGEPQTATATGRLDLRSHVELPEGVAVVDGITYSGSNWGESAAGEVTIRQKNLETERTMTVAEGLTGSSEGASVELAGQNTDSGLGHKLFHAVRGTVLESFVTFVFSGFERGLPSNPWDAGPDGNEPDVQVYVDDDPNAEPPPGKELVIEGEGPMGPKGPGVPWNDRREEITEIFVASGVVLNASALAGYPNLQRIVFEDQNYRLPHEAMDWYLDHDKNSVYMTWPSDGVYVCQFNGRQKVTAFFNEDGAHTGSLVDAYNAGFDPILFSTVPLALIDAFPAPSTIEPITGEDDTLEGWEVILNDDLSTPIELSDDIGPVVIDLNGHNVVGREGVNDEDAANRNGQPAFVIRKGETDGDPLELTIIDSLPDDTPDVIGGKGADGNPAGNGGPAIYVDPEAHAKGAKVIVGPNVTLKGGDAGTGLGQDGDGEEVQPGEPGPAVQPEGPVEVLEGGTTEGGEPAEGGVEAWAKVSLPSSMMWHLPQGVTAVGNELWFWRRVGGKTGAATFDFGELPLDWFAHEGITPLTVAFVDDEIDVDTIKAPANFSFRFVGAEETMLRAKTGKSIFEIVGAYGQKEGPAIVDPGQVKPVVVKSAPVVKPTGAEPEHAEAETETADPVVVWENLTFTCREEHAADRWGGAIRMEGGAMQVVSCTFTDCFADDYGGAIFAFGLERDSSVTGCRFERCFVDGMYGYGGAIYASAKVAGHAESGVYVRFEVSSSTFVNNAAVNGGAICTMRDANVDDLVNEQPVELVISQTGFLENAAEYDGGAIFAEGPVTVKGTSRGGPEPVVPDPLPVHPIIVGAVRSTSFYGNFAGGSGGAIAMDCVVGDWFVPAKLSIGESTEFAQNLASNAYEYALGGAIAHLQPGGELEVFGARFVGNEARATGFNTGLAYALGGAVYADADATVSLEKTRFFGNWAVSDSAYAYGGAGAFATGTAKVTACSFDGNGVAAPDEYYGGALDFAGTDALVKDSTFRGSNVEAVDAYGANLAFTNCVVVGNGTLNEDEGEVVYTDVYAVDSAVDMAWTAYGSYLGEGTSPESFDNEANHNLPGSTTAIYDPAEGAEPTLNPEGYVPAAALGLVQEATDINNVAYGSKFWGYSMGAYECRTIRDGVGIVVTIDPEEYAWTGRPVEPHRPVHVYDAIIGSNLVEGVDYTLSWNNNINPTDRAIVTATSRSDDYVFTAGTNFWITAYYVDYYLDDATAPYQTQMFGELSHSNVTAQVAPPAGYVYDPITSMPTGTVRRFDGECPYLRNGQLTLLVRYAKDEGGDDVPDIYQKKMHLKVVNGWWNEELNGADKIYWVTLYDEEGKWSTTGTGRLGENPTNRAETVALAAAGLRPFNDFTASGNWWYLFDASDFTKIAAPAGLEVRSGSWPFVIFLYDRKNESAGGRTGRGGRGGTGGTTDALTDYKLRAGLRISQFSYDNGRAAGEAWASVVDETTGQTLLDELLRRTKIDVLATPSLDKGEWSVIGSPTTDGEGGWGTDERPAAETPAQMFFKLRLR